MRPTAAGSATRWKTTLLKGQSLVIRDVDVELPPGDAAVMFNAIGIKAVICCPLVKDNGLRALIAVHQTTPRRATPRDWTEREVATVLEVVERCWAAIEQRNAEETLRASEALLRIARRAARTDVHDLMQAEPRVSDANEALRNSERRLSDLLKTVRLISVMLDRSAHITYCNDYLLNLTG